MIICKANYNDAGVIAEMIANAKLGATLREDLKNRLATAYYGAFQNITAE